LNWGTKVSAVASACLVWGAAVDELSAQGAAEGASTNAALAEATYEEGRAALERGDNERACSLLKASSDFERALGTSLALAHCFEVTGKTASAWTLFLEVEAWARRVGDDRRSQIARLRATGLRPKLTRAVFAVSRGPHEPRALFIDGNEVDSAAWSVEFPIDPGKHQLEATAEGHSPWRQEVVVVEGPELVTLSIPPLRVMPKAPVDRSPQPQRESSQRDRLDVPESSSTWTWVTAGSSVAALAGAGTLTWLAWRDDTASDEHCRTATLCSERGVELRDRAYERAAWATGVGTAGLALVGVAGYLYLTDDAAPERPEITADISPSEAKLVVRGMF